MGGCEYVNPDNIARDKFGDWNATDSVLQAARHAQDIREKCLDERRSLAFETVLSMPDKIDFIQRAKNAGFFIRLFFVSTDSPTINAKRVAMRVMQGGHDVPIGRIISRYTRSLASCSPALKLANRGYVYDNSIDNSQARLLFRTADGSLTKSYGEINSWAQEGFNAMKKNV